MADYFEEQQQRREEAYPTVERALAYWHDGYARLLDLGWRDPRWYPPKPGEQRYIEFINIGGPLVHVRGPYAPGDDPMADQAIVHCHLWHGFYEAPMRQCLLDNPRVSAGLYRHVAMQD